MAKVQALRAVERFLLACAAIFATLVLYAPECLAQTSAPAKTPDDQWFAGLSKNPELMTAIGRLLEKLQTDIQYPPARTESRLLALLPESTVAYIAYPNYGEVLHQALMIIRKEREENAALREFWQRKEVAAIGPKIEDSIEKLYQLSQYMGDEIVISGGMEGREVKLLIVAQVKKPGLKPVLEQIVSDLAGNSPPAVIVFDPEELEIAKDRNPGQEPVILVRPDYVIGALDVPTLRRFNERLDRTANGFASAPFGQRLAQAYQGGVTIVGAADLQKLMSLLPITTEKTRAILQSTGFADVKYLVGERRTAAGREINEGELTFLGRRHGVASWLAAPSHLGSLDFASPKAMMIGSVKLKNLAEVFEDIQEIDRVSDSHSFATLAQMEQAMQLSVKDDLLRLLAGEITLELDALPPPAPVWKAILKADDPAHLQTTFSKLMTLGNGQSEPSEEAGVTYYKVRIPSGAKPTEFAYAFVDGYLVVASSREAAVEAVRLHKSGESLGKSPKFLAALPPGHPQGVSALMYQDAAAMMASQLKMMGPEMGNMIGKLYGGGAPRVGCAYGEEASVRGESTSMAYDLSTALIVAAIAIPNLLRSRMAANEASAVGTLRTVNTAQVTYSATYEKRGFAPDLATLGPNPAGRDLAPSEEHANLIDSVLGNDKCVTGTWCESAGYRFSIRTTCMQQQCTEYVVTATPLSDETGKRNFCSASDGVIRSNTAPPIATPLRASECRKWEPVQ